MTTAIGTAAVAQARSAAVDNAFETLKTYDWGADPETLNAIDEAIIATHGDAAAREALEKRLVDALAGGISRSAQDYVCRRLRTVGTRRSVETLAALLPNEKTSHIARYALERIPDEQAVAALQDALPRVNSKLKPGIIGSLGKRRDAGSIGPISKLLGHSDVEVAQAAAHSLASIGTPAAARELSAFAKKASGAMKLPAADACLVCAGQLLADGQKSEATALYKQLNNDNQPAHIKIAAMRGMLTAASKK
jgi:HEAT repeat protein